MEKNEFSDWLDNQDVMQALHISLRTLQTFRSNGILPFSRIGLKIYYLRSDILKILSDNYRMHRIKNYDRTNPPNPQYPQYPQSPQSPNSPSYSPSKNFGDGVFSFFKAPVTNTIPHSQTTLRQVYNAIKGDCYKERTAKWRSLLPPLQSGEKTGVKRNLKATIFDYCTFSGTFTSRNNKALIKHSGLLCIDFDHLQNLEELRRQLLKDDYFETQLLFVSPSGDGLKWIIQITPALENANDHGAYFLAVANYIQQTYGVAVDKSGRDLSRACFLPHDPQAYINPQIVNSK